MNPTPLILSSTPPPVGVDENERDSPRVDFIELARELDAQISYPTPADAPLRGLERKLGLTVGQAVRARRRDATMWVSLSEAVGLPLATLDRGRTPHVMIAHNLM